MTNTERSGPPSPREEENTPVWKLAEAREAETLKGRLVYLEPKDGDDPDALERLADAHFARADELEQEIVGAPIASVRDLSVALDLLGEYHRDYLSFADARDQSLVCNIRDFAERLAREREAGPDPLKPAIDAGEALDVISGLKAIVRGLSVAIRALDGPAAPSNDERQGALSILRAELARAGGLEGRFLDVISPRKKIEAEKAAQ